MREEITLDYWELYGKTYPVRTLEIREFGISHIASERLNDVMFDEDGRYKSSFAQKYDEAILFFMDDESLIKLSDKELKKEVENNLDFDD